MVPDFEAKLNEYAHLLVEVGLNLQPGQTPRINTGVDCAPLARMCAAACYEKGARDVMVDWRDEVCTRERYLHADEAVFSEFPDYLTAKFNWMLDKGCPNLSIVGEDPEMLKGVDPNRIQASQLAAAGPTKPWHDAMMASRYQWCRRLPHPVLGRQSLPGQEPGGRPGRPVGGRVRRLPHQRGREGRGALEGACGDHRPPGQNAQ